MTECLIRPTILAGSGIIAAFSLRTGGVSPPPFDSLNLGEGTDDAPCNIAENLRIFSRAAGLGTLPHRARQVHGTDFMVCRGAGCTHDREADILIGLDGAAVAVRTADCVPILLADAQAGVVAAVHAGWRGTAARAAAHAVRLMRRYGADPERIRAAIGPAIGPCCFRIGADVAARLQAAARHASSYIQQHDQGIHADLPAINRQLLTESGLKPTHIETVAACTCCDVRRFFSWRRDGAQSGRHLAVVALAGAA